jgi:hypothetical protein
MIRAFRLADYSNLLMPVSYTERNSTSYGVSSCRTNGSHSYFDSIARIGSASYMPSDQDVLRSRVKTTGITESHFRIGELHYKLYDVRCRSPCARAPADGRQ